MADDATTKNILVADIGGTHSRFALFSWSGERGDVHESLVLTRKVRFATRGAESTADMMRFLTEAEGEDGGGFTPESSVPARVAAAVFAVPGPTAVADPAIAAPPDDVRRCPNMTWPVEAAVVAKTLGGAPVRLINDFVANGFACALAPRVIDATTVLEGTPQPGFPQAVIGAGTGLGQCLILPGDPPRIIGSEGGHVLFPYVGEEEAALARHMAEHSGTPRIDGDAAVAGEALSRIYSFYSGKTVHPHEAAPLAAKDERVLGMIARLYGRAVCHYVLTTLALGGVFITGGVAANLPQVLEHPEFVAELKERNTMRDLLKDLPVRRVRNQDAGLWGAAACALYMPS